MADPVGAVATVFVVVAVTGLTVGQLHRKLRTLVDLGAQTTDEITRAYALAYPHNSVPLQVREAVSARLRNPMDFHQAVQRANVPANARQADAQEALVGVGDVALSGRLVLVATRMAGP